MILGTSFKQIWIPSPKRWYISMHSGQWFMRRFLNIYQKFLLLPFVGPQKGPTSLFEQFEIPIPQACFLSSLVEIDFLVLEKIFEAFSYILLCKFLSPWGRAIRDSRDFIWTNLNPLSQKMIRTKYKCIPASSSWEEDFWRFIKIFLILPLIAIGSQKGPTPLFEHIWIPIPQAWFLPSLVEIGPVVLE